MTYCVERILGSIGRLFGIHKLAIQIAANLNMYVVFSDTRLGINTERSFSHIYDESDVVDDWNCKEIATRMRIVQLS